MRDRLRLRRLGPAVAVLALALLALTGSWPRAARAQASKEYDLKAVLLFNFTQFVEWPPASFPAPEAPFVIGIVGHDPFGPALDELVRAETRERRRIVVERYRSPDAIGRCQILFVDGSERRNLPRILAAVQNRPVLTVADFEAFTNRGGMVLLLKNADGKITLRINLAAAKACGLEISARLLRVAEIVPKTGA